MQVLSNTVTMRFCSSWSSHFLRLKLHITPFLITILFFLIVPCRAQLLFNYTGFNPNTQGINYSGDAAPSDPVIHLTLNQNDKGLNQSTGRITYFEAMRLRDMASGKMADFSTYFSFTINSLNKSLYSDGIAFFLAPVGFPIPSVQEGAGIGLVSGNQILNSTMNPFVAVEFDTYRNDWDPPHDHVGININSMISKTNMTWLSRIPVVVMNEAWISYNSTTKNLSVSFTSFPSNKTSIKNLSYQVDLSKYLPEWVSFGISAATGRRLWEIHALHSWNFSSSIRIDPVDTKPPTSSPNGPNPSIDPVDTKPPTASPNDPNPRPNSKNKGKLLVGLTVSASAFILTMGLIFLWFCFRKKSNRVEKEDKHVVKVPYEFENKTGPKKFSYEVLSAATKNFAEGEKIGQGGFGGVYKGFLSQLNSYVAVKRVSKGSKQGIKEYVSEVRIVSQVRHRNLVQLIGWCHEERELLLVYEFMSNGSLDFHLFKENMFLTWVMRYNIARGLASALLYLHEEWEQCVLHRDIKSSNVMLDSNFNAKLGDFGLARLVDHGKESETTLLAGTMGYMSPECVMTGKVNKETDVYSFGIVALEIASGRKPINPKAKQGEAILVEWVWHLHGEGKLVEAADPKLSADYDEKQLKCLLIVGLWCAHPDHKLRPSIRQAIQVLNFEAPLPSLASTMPMLTYTTAEVDMCADSLSLTNGVAGYEQNHSSSSNDNVNYSRLNS